jgi:hypothetical protein
MLSMAISLLVENHIGASGMVPWQAAIGASAYYNVVKPDFGPNWQIRAQVQLMFPK